MPKICALIYRNLPCPQKFLATRLGIRLAIYLDDMLIIGRTMEETIALRDTVILLVQCLGFVVNQKKSVMTPVQEIEFLGMIVNSREMTISLPQKKLKSIKQMVSGFVSESRDNSFRVNKGVRPSDINDFGHSPIKTPLSFSPATTNSGTKEKWLLRKSSVTEQRTSIGASLVGEKHRNIQWKDLNSTSSSSSFTDRCFTHRLGDSLGRNENWRDMDSAGEKDAHKQTETSCMKTGPGDLFESTGDKVTAYSDKQYSVPDLLFENGGHKKTTNGLSFQTNLETAIKEKSNCDSRVPSQCTEQACRHRISSQDRFFGMEASPLSVPKTLCENDKAINRPLYFQGISPASNNVAWRRKPYSLATNAFSITWNKEFYYAFPSFCLITQVLNKIEKDKTKKLILITPCWQHSCGTPKY